MTRAELSALQDAYNDLCGQSAYSHALARQKLWRVIQAAEAEHTLEDAANDAAEAEAYPINLAAE